MGDWEETDGGTLAFLRIFEGPLASRRDAFRSAVVHEPRGSEALVGALLVEPVDPTCAAGVIFFNTVGLPGMCDPGTTGLLVPLEHRGAGPAKEEGGVKAPRTPRCTDETWGTFPYTIRRHPSGTLRSRPRRGAGHAIAGSPRQGEARTCDARERSP